MSNQRIGALVQRPVSDNSNSGSLNDSDKDGVMKMTLAKKLSKEEIYKASQEIKENACPSLAAGIKSKTYLFIAVMAMCSSMYNYFFNSAWKNYGYRILHDVPEQQFSLILSAASVCNSVARLSIGILMQKISFKVLYICVVSLEIITAFTVTSFATTYPVYLVYVCIALFCLGSHVTLFPTMTTKAFGVEVGRKIYPFVYQCFSAASLIQYFIYKYIPKDNLGPLFSIFGTLSLCALILAILFTDEVDWS